MNSYLFTIRNAKLQTMAFFESAIGQAFWIVPLAATLLFQNCSDVKFKSQNESISNTNATGIDDGNEIPVPQTFKTHSITYIQDSSSKTSSLDLLFVVDSSSSLDQERQQIAQNIQTFVDKIGPSVSLNVAVLLGHAHKIINGQHVTSGHFSGRLYSPPTVNVSPVIGFGIENWNSAMIQLLTNLKNLPSDAKSDGGEMGLLSLQNLTSENLPYFAIAKDQGFFRDDAGLAVIFVADENDICANYPAGVTRVADTNFTQGIESELYAENIYCGPKANRIVSPNQVIKQLQRIQKSKPLVVSGILYPGPQPAPLGTENEIGYGYIDTIRMLNFTPVNIGDQIPDGLASIGSMVNEQLLIKTKFEIKNAPQIDLADCSTQVLPKSIEIKVDNKIVPYQFDIATCVVQIDPIDAGQLNSVINIKFDYTH